MSRKHVIAGNWKMHTSLEDGAMLADNLATMWAYDEPLMIIAPPLSHLHSVASAIAESNLMLAAQNGHPAPSGAYTGEVSISMLADFGVSHVIVGHSERREIFGESNAFVREKIDAVLSAGLEAIFCCGEALDIRENGDQENYVKAQLEESLLHLEGDQLSRTIIAYEPIWAIGTGVTASPQQAQEMHAYIRSVLRGQYGQGVAESTTILYGGSVKPANADALFAGEDVDGGLVGGASLDADSFLQIAHCLQESVT